jgi:hypothetical protein
MAYLEIIGSGIKTKVSSTAIELKDLADGCSSIGRGKLSSELTTFCSPGTYPVCVVSALEALGLPGAAKVSLFDRALSLS